LGGQPAFKKKKKEFLSGETHRSDFQKFSTGEGENNKRVNPLEVPVGKVELPPGCENVFCP